MDKVIKQSSSYIEWGRCQVPDASCRGTGKGGMPGHFSSKAIFLILSRAHLEKVALIKSGSLSFSFHRKLLIKTKKRFRSKILFWIPRLKNKLSQSFDETGFCQKNM